MTVRSVTKRFGDVLAVDEVAFELHAGRITCLLGPSGCGKSTLMRIIAGLEAADEGEIEAEARLLEGAGVRVQPEQRRIGLVFQDFALFPHLTALANVTFGLKGKPAAEKRKIGMELLDRFGLADRASSWPHNLSGGEQQRVAIARALAPRPSALLLDEPFSGLDGDLRAHLRVSVLTGLRDSDAAVLIVTHDPEEAMLLGDDLLLMSEGRVIQRGTPEECYRRPRSAVAARLLGRANVLPAVVESGRAECAFGSWPVEQWPDGPATAMLRPEALRPSTNGVAAEVVAVHFGGVWYEVHLRVGEQRATMRLIDQPPAVGDVLKIDIAPQHAALLEQA